jgi:hypothetical protein
VRAGESERSRGEWACAARVCCVRLLDHAVKREPAATGRSGRKTGRQAGRKTGSALLCYGQLLEHALAERREPDERKRAGTSTRRLAGTATLCYDQLRECALEREKEAGEGEEPGRSSRRERAGIVRLCCGLLLERAAR